jgi:hypothetical protein
MSQFSQMAAQQPQQQQWNQMQCQQLPPQQRWNYQNQQYLNQNQYQQQYINQYLNAQQLQWQNQMRFRQQFNNSNNNINNTNITNTTNVSTINLNASQTQALNQSQAQQQPQQPSSVMHKCLPSSNPSPNYHQMNPSSVQKCQTVNNPEIQCGSVESTGPKNATNANNMRPETYQRTLEYVYQQRMSTDVPINGEPSSPAAILSPSGSCKVVSSSCPTPKPSALVAQQLPPPMPSTSSMSCRSTSTQLSTNMVINDLNSTLNSLVEESRFLKMSIN